MFKHNKKDLKDIFFPHIRVPLTDGEWNTRTVLPMFKAEGNLL